MDETLRGSGEGWGHSHWHFAPGGARPFKATKYDVQPMVQPFCCRRLRV